MRSTWEEDRMSALRGRLAPLAAMVALSVGLAACGGDDNDTSSGSSSGATTQAAASPEDTIAPDAAVGAGLVKLKGVAEKVAGAPDGDESNEASEGLETVWRPIEGTVKKNEPDLYLDVEDSFERLSSGDLDNAKKGEQSLETAVDAYLAKHPEGADSASASSGEDEDEGSPESHIAPDAEVTAGLAALKVVGDKVGAAADGATSKRSPRVSSPSGSRSRAPSRRTSPTSTSTSRTASSGWRAATSTTRRRAPPRCRKRSTTTSPSIPADAGSHSGPCGRGDPSARVARGSSGGAPLAATVSDARHRAVLGMRVV
jgi:hypothetical protein